MSNAERREPGFGEPSRDGPAAVWPWLVFLMLAAGVLVALQARRPKPASPWVGRALPPLDAAGWLNTDAPLSIEELRGKVVLVDFWATWCQPCVRHMPEVVEYHERFAERGVVVVGLTAEPATDAERLRRFVEQAGMTWPIAYEAGIAFNALGVQGIPTYVLYDRTGRSVWGGHSLAGLEDATVAALARIED